MKSPLSSFCYHHHFHFATLNTLSSIISKVTFQPVSFRLIGPLCSPHPGLMISKDHFLSGPFVKEDTTLWVFHSGSLNCAFTVSELRKLHQRRPLPSFTQALGDFPDLSRIQWTQSYLQETFWSHSTCTPFQWAYRCYLSMWLLFSFPKTDKKPL